MPETSEELKREAIGQERRKYPRHQYIRAIEVRRIDGVEYSTMSFEISLGGNLAGHGEESVGRGSGRGIPHRGEMGGYDREKTVRGDVRSGIHRVDRWREGPDSGGLQWVAVVPESGGDLRVRA